MILCMLVHIRMYSGRPAPNLAHLNWAEFQISDSAHWVYQCKWVHIHLPLKYLRRDNLDWSNWCLNWTSFHRLMIFVFCSSKQSSWSKVVYFSANMNIWSIIFITHPHPNSNTHSADNYTAVLSAAHFNAIKLEVKELNKTQAKGKNLRQANSLEEWKSTLWQFQVLLNLHRDGMC